MKKFAKKTFLRSLASACFVGSSCCTALLCGQQLQPIADSAENLPPIVSSSQVNDESLPPIVRSVQANQDDLPPVVSVEQMLGTASATPDTAPARGTNFPTDGEQRIAQFIQANGGQAQPFDVQPAAYPQLPIQSPSDIPIQPVPVPSVVPPPATGGFQNAAPSIGGTIVTPIEGSSARGSGTRIEGSSIRGSGLPGGSAAGSGTRIDGSGSRVLGSGLPGAQPQGGTNYFHEGIPEQSPINYDSPVTDYGQLSDTFACCGFICDSRSYFIVDALYWERTDGDFRASNIPTIDDFDYSWGGRITWGWKEDCTRGFEVSYLQFDPWLAVSNATAPGTLTGALFGDATGDLPPGAFTAFQNGTFQEQFQKTDLHSLELNRTWWGSDVVKTFIGARYIHFDDEFHLSSVGIGGAQGIHSIDTTNNLVGLHIGGEVLYDIGYRLSYSIAGKAGGYANFHRGRKFHFNNGTTFVNTEDDETDFSASFEIGAFLRYKLTPNVRLRAGYEAFALIDVFDVESNFNPLVQSTSGQSFNQGDAFFHGPTVGFEIYR